MVKADGPKSRSSEQRVDAFLDSKAPSNVKVGQTTLSRHSTNPGVREGVFPLISVNQTPNMPHTILFKDGVPRGEAKVQAKDSMPQLQRSSSDMYATTTTTEADAPPRDFHGISGEGIPGYIASDKYFYTCGSCPVI
ncbi:hypothetical protein AWENTII_003216 [Aspergillus wentii]